MISPSLEELVALRGAARGLRLQPRRPTHTLRSGGHRSNQRGRGLEFQEVRPYVVGDDPRTIDWRVTARRGKPHTKLFREERERPVWLLADLNDAMFFGTRRQLKSSVVVRAAALLAWSVALAGDRLGAVVAAASGLRIIPPRAREAAVLPVLAALLELHPRAPGALSDSLGQGLEALAPLIHPGSLVLVLSDYATIAASGRSGAAPVSDDPSDRRPRAAAEARWATLAMHNEFRLFWVTDPLESHGLPDGRFRVGLPGRALSLDGASIRDAWARKWQERQANIDALATRINAPVTRLDTSATVEGVLQAELSGRTAA